MASLYYVRRVNFVSPPIQNTKGYSGKVPRQASFILHRFEALVRCDLRQLYVRLMLVYSTQAANFPSGGKPLMIVKNYTIRRVHATVNLDLGLTADVVTLW